MAQSLLSRLRSLVGPKRWDYVIYWTLSEDQRCLEFAGCLCSGADQVGQGCSDAHGLFTNRYCRDVMVPHPKSLTCEVLADFPVSFPLDVGVQGQVLLSGQPRWMHFSAISDPNIGHESVQTRVLIPIRNGLLELFVPKPVAENPSIVQYILAQWEACLPQPQIFDGNNMYNQTSAGLGGFNVSSEASAVSTLPWLSVADSQVPWETDRPICEPQIPINMASPSLNFLNQELHQHQQPQTSIQILPSKPDFKDSPHPSCLSKEMHAGDKTADFKQENPRADSSECSDHIEDDDDQKGTGRSGRRHLSKNLVAERKRRIKLNERLYALRALVPKITKMDKASILGDAIEYIKELQQEVKELQDELAETDGLDNGVQAVHDDDAHGRCLSKTENIEAITNPPREDLQTLQIDVNQLEAQVFNLRIFNDKREGCFVRLLQAMDALGLDILNCNITTFGTLVLNVFNAKKRDKEELHAEQLRQTLREMTLNPELVQQFEGTVTSHHSAM